MNVQTVGDEWMVSNEAGELQFVPVTSQDDLEKLPPCGLNEAMLRKYWPELLDNEDQEPDH